MGASRSQKGLLGAAPQALSREGNVFDPSATVWMLQGRTRRVTINWGLYAGAKVNKRELSEIKRFIQMCVETLAVETALSRFMCIKEYALTLEEPGSFGDLAKLSEYKTLVEDRNHSDAFRYVRICLEFIADRSSSICSPETLLEISKWKVKKRQTHLSISDGSNEEGPLDPAEESALRLATASRRLDAEPIRATTGIVVRALIVTFLNLGIRPFQAALMIEEDVVEVDAASGSYLLMVPRIKDGKATRAEMRPRPITRSHYELLCELMKANRKLPRGSDRTLFPQRYDGARRQSGSWRLVSTRMQEYLRVWAARMEVKAISGDALHLYPYRLRYTFATNLAAEMSPAELADVLDHVTNDSVMVYYELGPGFSGRMGKALERTWSKFRKLFLGEILPVAVDSNPTREIQTPSFFPKIGKLGLCGSATLCELYPPLSCYVCPKFQADEHADHEGTLNQLVELQKTRLEQTNRTIDRIKSQLDTVIIAIKQLLEILRALKWVRQQTAAGHSLPTTDDGGVDMHAIAERAGANAEVVVGDLKLRNLFAAIQATAKTPRRRHRGRLT